MKLDHEKKLENARNKLSNALKNLEEIFIKKIDESRLKLEILNLPNDKNFSLKEKIYQQELIIKNLGEEINKIQKINSDLLKENDFLKEKNKVFSDKIFKFKTDGSSMIQSVEDDITKIKNIIKNKS